MRDQSRGAAPPVSLFQPGAEATWHVALTLPLQPSTSCHYDSNAFPGLDWTPRQQQHPGQLASCANPECLLRLSEVQTLVLSGRRVSRADVPEGQASSAHTGPSCADVRAQPEFVVLCRSRCNAGCQLVPYDDGSWSRAVMAAGPGRWCLAAAGSPRLSCQQPG